MDLTPGTHGTAFAVGVGERGIMAARARDGPVPRKAGVVKELAAEFDFLPGHRVVRGHPGCRKTLRQLPDISMRTVQFQ